MYRPTFTITSSINSNIAEIERIRTLVERSRILPSQEIILRWRALVEATRSSTGIEGNLLNKEQVQEVLQGKRIAAHERFITEVKNYKEALGFIRKRALQLQPITKEDILRLHTITMRELVDRSKTGAFRKTPIFVVNVTKKGEEVQYEGPPAKIVASSFDDLLLWLQKEGSNLHPVLTAGILHYEFVSIHPFADGNGRVARLLTMWYLNKTGYGLKNVLVPETYYFAGRQAYYRALNQAKTYSKQRVADPRPWLEDFVVGIATVARECYEKITLVAVLPESGSGQVITLEEEDFRIIDFVISIGKVTIQDVIDMLEIPKRSAQRKIKHLTEIGVFSKRGKGRATYYILKNIPKK